MTSRSRLARTLQNAIVLGESKGDHRQAAKSLDAALAGTDRDTPAPELIEALVYRAELAIRTDDGERADVLLSQVRDTTLDDVERASLGDALANTAELERVRVASKAPSVQRA